MSPSPEREERPIIEVSFLCGPLDRTVHRMVGIGERLVAWEHLQAKGVVQVSTPDRPERQPNLWKRHGYHRIAGGENWAHYQADEGGHS